MKLTLRIDSMNVVKWWVDALFSAHKDAKGQTGATMSMGQGSIIRMSKKKNISTRSSTESEVVGADGGMSQILWTIFFRITGI